MQSFPQFNVYGTQKGLRSSPSNTFGKSESLHSLLPLKNGGVILVERSIKEEDCICKVELEDAYFSVPVNQKSQKVCKFQIEGSTQSVPLPLLWFETGPKDIHKVDQNSYFSVEKTMHD